MQFKTENEIDNKAVGTRIRAARKESGFTKRDNFEKTNYCERHISDIEQGITMAEPDIVLCCCRLFHKYMNYFYSDIIDFSRYHTGDAILLDDIDRWAESTTRSLTRILKFFLKVLEKTSGALSEQEKIKQLIRAVR